MRRPGPAHGRCDPEVHRRRWTQAVRCRGRDPGRRPDPNAAGARGHLGPVRQGAESLRAPGRGRGRGRRSARGVAGQPRAQPDLADRRDAVRSRYRLGRWLLHAHHRPKFQDPLGSHPHVHHGDRQPGTGPHHRAPGRVPSCRRERIPGRIRAHRAAAHAAHGAQIRREFPHRRQRNAPRQRDGSHHGWAAADHHPELRRRGLEPQHAGRDGIWRSSRRARRRLDAERRVPVLRHARRRRRQGREEIWRRSVRALPWQGQEAQGRQGRRRQRGPATDRSGDPGVGG